EALKQGNARMRTQVAAAIGALGPKGADAVPELLPLLRENDPLLREAAARTLGRVARAGDTDVIQALAAALRDPKADSRLRYEAAHALSVVGGDAAEVLAAFAAALTDDNAEVRTEAAKTLVRLRADVPGARPLVTAVANDRFVETYVTRLPGAPVAFDYPSGGFYPGAPAGRGAERGRKAGAKGSASAREGPRKKAAANASPPPVAVSASGRTAPGESVPSRVLPPSPWPPPGHYEPRVLDRRAVAGD